ncbi:DEAD/DEAH box helicase [Halobaculum sp. D14]|uniref:DEAD/DEAH box helicase n=1 Tax=Halobaculum sp. D14 TaxID=3421642 RepID=UPI003EBF642C
MSLFTPDYRDFGEYEAAELAGKSSLEQLLLMDSELADYIHLPNYVGALHPADMSFLYSAYDREFSAFVTERLDGATGGTRSPDPSVEFSQFREGVAELNKKLATYQNTEIDSLTESAERLLMKDLRMAGFDPSQMELDHMSRDGTLYLLELYASAVQQEIYADSDLLQQLQGAVDEYQETAYDELVDSLRYPVLMVTLWKNQRKGLERWLDAGRWGVLEMATATGKTVAGIAAIAHLCGVLPNHDFDEFNGPYRSADADIAVVAHSNAILSQWEREIRELLGLNVAGGDRSGQPEALSFSTGSVEFHTIHSMLPQHGGAPEKTYDLVICDEAHHYANTNESGFGGALQSINANALLGLSATLGREESKKREELESVLGEVVYTYTVDDAQRHGIIPEFDWTVHPTALEASEADEWEDQTSRITDLFAKTRRSRSTRQTLKRLDVPFSEFRDLGDFITAHKAAGIELDDVPNRWKQLHAAIMSRNAIRHRSRPKLDAAIDLAREYLTQEGAGIKIVMFTMNIDMVDEIEDRLADVSENVFAVHSEVAASNKKKNKIVRKRIDAFQDATNGVLVAPKLLDEGIDVPDAEVGINVAGTKTELQLIQRMGRVLRKHGNQEPHFHHYVAVPEGEDHLEGVDSKELAKQLHWVRELGERIQQQPAFEPAAIDPNVVERAKRRGNELWAEELIEEEAEVETIDGPLDLKAILNSITYTAAEVLLETVPFGGGDVSEADWETGMQAVRSQSRLEPSDMQQLWWLYPLYQDDTTKLKQLLTAIRERQRNLPESRDSVPVDGDSGGDDGSGEDGAGGNLGSGEDVSGGNDSSTAPDQTVGHELANRELKRLHDIADMEPTKNAELCSEWGYADGSALYEYVNDHLIDYIQRNENSLMELSPEGREIVEPTECPDYSGD